jgi:hypothetical protein
MRALLGPMSELGLHRLHRFAARHGLARDRVPTHLVMAEQSETELLPHELQAREQILARAFLRDGGLGSGQEAPLPLPSVT